MTISELAPLIKARKLSSIELTRNQLERIHKLNGRLKAFATVSEELALEQATLADTEIGRGLYRGPLHGIPVAVKDLCFTKGIPTMGGTSVLADHVPQYDATVVERLRDAGAVLLGKLNLTEGAMAGYHPRFDVPENPWKVSHWPGSSSSGSAAAVAAGLVHAAIGTDTGGSIRHPSAACGITGLKPTWGRVSRHGVLALAESLDHVGPMTRSSRDAGLVLQAIAGRDANDATSLVDPVADMTTGAGKGVRGLRIGWDEDFTRIDMSADYADAVQQGLRVMEDLGAEVVPVRMPARLRDYIAAWDPICQAEAVAAHRAWFPARASEYGPFFRQWLERGAVICAADYAAAHHLRLACNGDLFAMMKGIDVFACPSTPRIAFPVTPGFLYGPIPPDREPWQTRYTAPFNFAGIPTISLPCGLSEAELPFSIQFAGKALREDLLVAVGDAYQQATGWHRKHPPGW